MLDMGFMPDLKRILALLPKQRQNLMFSATFSNEIKKLADDFLTNPTLIEVARSNATAENVTQKVYLLEQSKKQALLIQLLRSDDSKQVLVFTKTKITASRLSRALQKEGIAADAIHGDKSQKERLEALDAFKAGKVTVLVATDVAARGLDISDLPMVINYEIPSAPEDYVHRIGRTGRAGASGVAISLVCEDEEKYLSEIEKLIKRTIDKEKAVVSASTRKPSHHATREPVHKNDDATESNRGASNSAKHTAKPRQHTRKPSSDPWFDKPYEPASSNADVTKNTSGLNRKAPVAALLGGLRSGK
jgi:ATP-dependent RNA helicase RhlE